MRRIVFGAATLLLLGANLVHADDKSDAMANATALLDALVKEDYETASKNFGNDIKAALPPDKLKDVWKSILQHGGSFKKVVTTHTEERGRGILVTLTCEFEKAVLDMDVVVEGKQVVSLYFRPNAKVAYKAPAYVKKDAFREIEVKVNPGEWELPGTLTLPKGDSPFPAVILVHGSGPHDRDEMIGPNLPFRDLAGGLASKGVAVLRYEKRTKQYGPKMTKENVTITIKEEVIDDALAAAALLRTRKEIDAKQIYLLGHSLGANLAPLLAQRDEKLAGVILLAGTTRQLSDVIIDQADYLLSLPLSDEQKKNPEVMKQYEEQKKHLEEMKKHAARINDPKLEETSVPTDRILGASVAYWLSLRSYDAAATAAKLKTPMLILQGERDYQVTMKDFEGWKKALKGHDNVRFKAYPKLNHLFMEGEGKSSPSEYMKENHVSAEVIDDIVDWLTKR